MTNLATLEELAATMRLPLDTIDEDAAEAALAGASALVREEVGQDLDLVIDDVVVLRSTGGRQLLLPELPVLEVALVRVRRPGGEWAELVEGTDYEVELGRVGILWRIGGGTLAGFDTVGEWPRTLTGSRGPHGWVEVTYSHGYATPGLFGSGDIAGIERLPEVASTVTKRVAARGYVNPEAVAQETNGRSTVGYGDAPGLYLSDRDRRDLHALRPGTRGGSR